MVSLTVSAASLTSHEPIDINHDGDISAENGISNPGATGTEEDPFIIENLSIDASDTHGIDITYTNKHFIIRNCKIINGQNEDEELYNNGIFIHNLQSGYIIVENCNLTDDNGGVVFEHSPNCISRNNVFRDNGAGMRIFDCEDITVENNQVFGGGHGFYLDNVTEASLTGNLVDQTYNPCYSIYQSSSCVLDGNTANNSEGGIYLYHSQDNTIKNNKIENCWSYGFATQNAPGGGQSSDNNQIYKNYFIYNGVNKGVTQAYDTDTNLWSVGSTGNYWSDWQPPEHNDSNGDGVVDEDRSISGGSNEDNYPLVLPEGYLSDSDSINQSTPDNNTGSNEDNNNTTGGVEEQQGESEEIPNIVFAFLIIAVGIVVAIPIYKKAGTKIMAVVIVIALVAGIGFFIVLENDGNLFSDDGSDNGDGANLTDDNNDGNGGSDSGSDNDGNGNGGSLESSTGLPVHSGASKANLPSNIIESELAIMYGEDEIYDIYVIDAPIADVCSWYDTAMSDAGWSNEYWTLSDNCDANNDYSSQAFFEKNGVNASVSAMSQDNIKAMENKYGEDFGISGTLVILETDGAT